MKKSMRFRMTLVFTIASIVVFAVLWGLNNFGLERYYRMQKVQIIGNAYSELDIKVSEHDVEGMSDIMRKYSDKHNISIAVVDSVTSQAVVTTERDGEMLLSRFQQRLFGNHENENIEVLVNHDNYTICSYSSNDDKLSYIECFGYFSDNLTMVIMSSPVESLKESVQISNAFLMMIAIIVIILGSFIVFALAEQIEMLIDRLQATNTKLKSDLKKKEEQEKLQRAFIANVSHELKTPIALIQGYAEGLEEGLCNDEESRKYYSEVIADEADKMNQLVKELLELSSVESGKKFEKEVFNLSEMIESIADQSKILTDQKNVMLLKDITENIMVKADVSKMESVVSNYLNNAIHYVNDGGQIIVSLHKEKKNAVCKVFNSGSHIPEEDIKNIWDKFYKVDKARTRAYGGSGIGLSIVKAVMEGHNGSYGVSNKDDGVEFWFEIKIEEPKKSSKKKAEK